MQKSDFRTSAHAKCILAGEHTVLRGGTALVMPVASKVLVLTYSTTEKPIEMDNQIEGFVTLFWKAFKKGLVNLNKHAVDVHGKFYFENHVPIGAGLGFSAALCVVIARWLVWKNWLDAAKIFPFAKNMEDLFHGKSSGADIAGVLANDLIHFEQSGEVHEVKMKWKPKFYLSYSGIMKKTSRAISKVNQIYEQSPELAKLLDDKMQNSVLQIENALLMKENKGFSLLVSAIEQAKQCFEEWDLITPKVQLHMDQLRKCGAMAVKPTGAGLGGYVLSLWDHAPDKSLPFELIPL